MVISLHSGRKHRILAGLLYFAVYLFVLACLYNLSRYNFLLFHCFMEMSGVIISCCVFILSTFTSHHERNGFSILGIGYLFTAVFDFLHTLSYQGMHVFSGNISYADQLWICARFFEAVTILFFITHIKHSVHHFTVIVVCYFAAASAVIIAIFYFKILPVCFTQDGRQTAFKLCSDAVTCILLILSYILLKNKTIIEHKNIRSWFSLAILLAFCSEVCFVLYGERARLVHIAGLMFKILSFYFIYKSILLVNIRSPLALIFQELNKNVRETKSLNDQLSQSEAKYKSISEELEMIMDNIPGLIFYKDKNNRYIKVNKYMATAHRKGPQEMEGVSLFNLYPRSDAENYYRDDQSVISSGTAKLNIEERWVTENGIKWLNVNKIPLVSFSGEILGVIGMAMDITAKKKSEEKILGLISELEAEKDAALKSSLTDGLTGICNRRYFDGILPRAIAAARREKQKLSIAMIDIDFFKNYNDTYGHVSGDICLQKVASALQSVLNRGTDTLSRYGGEEFVAVFENTDKKGALSLAGKMQKAVSELKLEHTGSKCSQFVTASIGVTTLIDVASWKCCDLIKFADTALYKAKENGRNRIEFYKPRKNR
jgi:diguanylate cyclase (GGDEF)-like protein/PAS domain S-box-containing protein